MGSFPSSFHKKSGGPKLPKKAKGTQRKYDTEPRQHENKPKNDGKHKCPQATDKAELPRTETASLTRTQTRPFPKNTKFVFAPLKRDFKIQGLLGSGSYGEVKLVQHMASGNHYAAKVFYKPSSPLHRAGDFNEWEVKGESLIMRQLDYPTLVRLYAVYEDSDSHTFILHLCEGGTLGEYLQDLFQYRCSNPADKMPTSHRGSSVPAEEESVPAPLRLLFRDVEEAEAEDSLYLCRGAGAASSLLSSPQRRKERIVPSLASNIILPRIGVAAAADSGPASKFEEGNTSAAVKTAACKLPHITALSSAATASTVASKQRRTVSTGLEPLNERETANVMADLLGSLAYMHRRGLVHRDIKIDNIFLLKSQRVEDSLLSNQFYLGDFGFSKKWRPDSFLRSYCGSPVYMAPEVVGAKGALTPEEALTMGLRAYTSKCDIWSAGVVMHALLTGEYPFAGKHSSDTLRRIVHGRLRLDTPVFDSISDEAIACLTVMLRRNPSSRPEALELLQQSSWLRHFAGERVRFHLHRLSDFT
uniref:Protein kinase domain-containing protein n=1 Tax=Palpitomonas bilix TaxID=652834 RepID=A0A7S3CW51_9EUKA|mmetsp:Transcript_11664/g.31377  ORF Transcript_11664/g.31377 Transcript_11664/m.31377 type:complete len:531 (+) Transcript_11664:307-1899(+)